ncbi:MAG: GAF domain-containing protein [Proteobacteria bacterium]|nr:GAF domain-containing protein [Pseudomonadota bacterium]
MRLALLSDLTREFARSTGDYQALLALIARRLGERLGDICLIRMITDGVSFGEVGGLYHPDPALEAELRAYNRATPQRVDEGVSGRALAAGHGILIAMTSPAQLSPAVARYTSIIERLAIRILMVIPLHAEGKPIGVATLMRCTPDRPYTPDDLALFEDLGSHASIAIANSRLIATLERELAERGRLAERLRLLSELTREFTQATDDATALLALIARRLGEVVGEACSIRLLEPEGQRTMPDGAFYHRDPDVVAAALALMTQHPQRVGEGIGGRACATKRSVWMPTITPDDLVGATRAEVRPLIVLLGVRSLIAVPMIRGDGEVIGVAVMSRSDPAQPYTAEDLRLIEDVVAHATISIVNSELLAATQRELVERQRAQGELAKAEELLRQAQKMDAIGRLAGGIAHDFNNVLSVILTYSAILLDDLAPTDPTRQDIEEIQRAGQRAAELTGQLLAFSRQQVVVPRVVDVNDVLMTMGNMARRIVGEDIVYAMRAAPRLRRIKADPNHLEQVFMNLVVNARDAMPHGGRLTIETQNVELDETYASTHPGISPGPHVMIAVSDTGEGMDRATCERIFEPFFTTKALGKGTGLGLSTVFGIVKQAAGCIGVYSEPGLGTTFKVIFPCTVELDAPPEPEAAPLASMRGSETILVVDDEPQIRVIVRQVLERQGYNVLDAGDGASAITVAHAWAGRIDLLLTDVVMPRMSGRELAGHLEPSYRGLKVLYMSGYTDDAIVHHHVLDADVELLPKPITPKQLLQRVRALLSA